MQINVCGFDPSLNNWGIAVGSYSVTTGILTISEIQVVQPVLVKTKQTRQNSLDVQAATQLFNAAYAFAQKADVLFVEVPVGSQSARASVGYGVCAGVLGSLSALTTPFIAVTPTAVKKTAVNDVKASKKQMIDWATSKHPEANWPTYNRANQAIVSEAKAEHMADAIAAIYAGLASDEFKQLLSLHRKNHANQTHSP